MFPIRVNHVHSDGSSRGMINHVAGGGGGVKNEREQVEFSFFRCFVVFVRFWGVVTAIGELRGLK